MRFALIPLGVALALLGLVVAAAVWACGVRFDNQQTQESDDHATF